VAVVHTGHAAQASAHQDPVGAMGVQAITECVRSEEGDDRAIGGLATSPQVSGMEAARGGSQLRILYTDSNLRGT
jgi:hypothetical protein